MKNEFKESNISFAYNSKGIFLYDGDKETRVYGKEINRKRVIKGKCNRDSFQIENVIKIKILLSVLGAHKTKTHDRKITINHKIIGVLERDPSFIVDLAAGVGVPIILKIKDYKIIYHRMLSKIDIYKEENMIGYSKKVKGKYKIYLIDDKLLTLVLALSLASIDSNLL